MYACGFEHLSQHRPSPRPRPPASPLARYLCRRTCAGAREQNKKVVAPAAGGEKVRYRSTWPGLRTRRSGFWLGRPGCWPRPRLSSCTVTADTRLRSGPWPLPSSCSDLCRTSRSASAPSTPRRAGWSGCRWSVRPGLRSIWTTRTLVSQPPGTVDGDMLSTISGAGALVGLASPPPNPIPPTA